MKKAQINKIDHKTTAIQRQYKKSLQNLQNQIFDSIEYWLIPFFKNEFMVYDSDKYENKESKKQKEPKKPKINIDFQIGDFVLHKNINYGIMQIIDIKDNLIEVTSDYGRRKIDLKDLSRAKIPTIPYSKSDTFTQRLEKIRNNTLAYATNVAYNIVKKQFASLLKNVNIQFKKNVEIDFTKIPFSKESKNKLDIMINNNISLIKSIPNNILDSLENSLSIASIGGNRQQINKTLSHIKEVTQNRIDLISRDQSSKALNAIITIRAKDAGFEYYEWVTSQDERVSKGYGGHIHLSGKIFRYDTPEAIIDSYGNKGHPAERPNCRCTQSPIYLMPNQKAVKTDLGYKIISLS